MTPDLFDIAVVGGGAVGCSVAYHAAKRGASVALFEADRIASGASGAAAGMLNAQAESHSPGPMLDLMLESRKMHETFSGELREHSGLDPEYIRAGTLRVATDEAFAGKLESTYEWQRREGLSAEWLDADDTRELGPGLSPATLAGLYFPEEGQINSPRLVKALALAAANMGAEILECASVSEFLMDGDRLAGLRSVLGDFHAGAVVLAGGAASGSLASKLGVEIPVFPVKGEILSVEARHPTPISANIWSDACYLVPKRDGRIVIGATEETGVYDRRPTLGGVARLSGAAARLVPEVSGLPFSSAWGGLRPGTPDGMPILGAADEWGNLFIATGHYRNGVLLAPITGEIISALALGEEPKMDVSPFSPGRLREKAKR
ncbi:MAG: glycine oxidase ThiO [Rubrobacteraceae bacterium]|jgi:glycine oxidase|nr:glycine oxidase ThiO [Rubrobacter sp.]